MAKSAGLFETSPPPLLRSTLRSLSLKDFFLSSNSFFVVVSTWRAALPQPVRIKEATMAPEIMRGSGYGANNARYLIRTPGIRDAPEQLARKPFPA